MRLYEHWYANVDFKLIAWVFVESKEVENDNGVMYFYRARLFYRIVQKTRFAFMDIRDPWMCTVSSVLLDRRKVGLGEVRYRWNQRKGLQLIGLEGMCKVGELSSQLAGHMMPATNCYVARGDSKYLPGKTEIERRRNFENLRAVYQWTVH